MKVLADDNDAAGEGAVTALFEDGTSHMADIVIGCDGIRSVIRTAVAGGLVQPKFTRTIAFRGLIPIEAGVKAMGPTIKERPHAYVGPHRVYYFPRVPTMCAQAYSAIASYRLSHQWWKNCAFAIIFRDFIAEKCLGERGCFFNGQNTSWEVRRSPTRASLGCTSYSR